MDPMQRIAEQRIAEAETRGELRGLPGEGRPLELDDLSGVPCELRPAYLMLKNAGFVPPDLHTRRLVREVEQLLEACASDNLGEQRRLAARLSVLEHRLERERERGRRLGGAARLEYEAALARRLG